MSDFPVVIRGSDSYEREVTSILKQIASFQTGRAVLAKIQAHGLVTIDPYTGTDINAATNAALVVMPGVAVSRIEFSPQTYESVIHLPLGIEWRQIKLAWPGKTGDEVLL